MVYSNIIIEITILSGSFVFCNSCVELSVGLTNVSDLAIAAFDLIYCSLSGLRIVFVLEIR